MKTQLAIRLATLALWIISGPTTLAQQGNLTQATFETTTGDPQNLASAIFTGRSAHVGDQV